MCPEKNTIIKKGKEIRKKGKGKNLNKNTHFSNEHYAVKKNHLMTETPISEATKNIEF